MLWLAFFKDCFRNPKCHIVGIGKGYIHFMFGFQMRRDGLKNNIHIYMCVKYLHTCVSTLWTPHNVRPVYIFVFDNFYYFKWWTNNSFTCFGVCVGDVNWIGHRIFHGSMNIEKRGMGNYLTVNKCFVPPQSYKFCQAFLQTFSDWWNQSFSQTNWILL